MKRVFPCTAVIGAVIVILIVTGATLWMSSGARSATDQAVGMVSDFYLEELAGRRSQVVSSFFETKTKQTERAAALMNPYVLSSLDTLRNYIGNVEALHGLSLFAVVDEDNIVYTDHTTYTGGSRYAFLAEGQSGKRMITTASTYGGGKQICLSVPVQDKVFMGKKLKTCFIEIDMDDIVSILAFNAEEKGTNFSLYYGNGANLTGLDFGPFGAKSNLLQEMGRYLSEDQAQALAGHFQNNEAGEVQFSLAGGEQILYYAPIPETGWMITVLIPKNLIYGQIGGIREKTMERSTIQILVTCASLLAFFAFLALKERRKSKALLEQERKIAVRDSLTGVGNKYAYTQKEAAVDSALKNGSAEPYALVVCDLNGLKKVNDTMGHTEGDQLIRNACRLICELYDHSPVYRIGGDEFAVFLQGTDYARREEILEELNRHAEKNKNGTGVVVAAGMAEYEPGDQHLSDTFRRADKIMYERKKQLKK